MQDQRNGMVPYELPDPDSRAYEAQKLVLLDLVVDAPAGRDRIVVLCELRELPPEDLDSTVDALVSVGLAQRCGDIVFAWGAASYFEYLWPTGL